MLTEGVIIRWELMRFWADLGLGTINRVELNELPLTPEAIITDANSPWAVDIDLVEKKVYWPETGGSPIRIRRPNFDGSNPEILINQNLSNPCGLTVDSENRLLFWTDTANNAVYKASIPVTDTDADSHIFMDSGEAVDSPMEIDIDIDMLNDKVFWIEHRSPTKAIRICNIDASAIGDISDRLLARLNLPYDLTLVPTSNPVSSIIYLSDYSGANFFPDINSYHVYSYNYIYSLETKLISTVAPGAANIDIAESILYWTDGVSTNISSANNDGSSETILLNAASGLNYPIGIVK